MPDLQLGQFLSTGLVLAGAIITILWGLSKWRAKSYEETKELVETRGERIEDLEAEVARLRMEVSELRGMVNALEAIKAEQIADKVVAELKPYMEGGSP